MPGDSRRIPELVTKIYLLHHQSQFLTAVYGVYVELREEAVNVCVLSQSSYLSLKINTLLAGCFFYTRIDLIPVPSSLPDETYPAHRNRIGKFIHFFLFFFFNSILFCFIFGLFLSGFFFYLEFCCASNESLGCWFIERFRENAPRLEGFYCALCEEFVSISHHTYIHTHI